MTAPRPAADPAPIVLMRHPAHLSQQPAGISARYNGRIVFQATVGRFPQIFTVSAGASPVELPLRVGAFDDDPAYSRDGTHVSFDQDIGPIAPTVHGIFIANADGSGAHRLTTGIRTKDAYDTGFRSSRCDATSALPTQTDRQRKQITNSTGELT